MVRKYSRIAPNQALGELIEDRQLLLRQADGTGHRPIRRLFYLGVGLMTLRASRVAGNENQGAFLDAFGRHLQPVFWLKWNVVLREDGRLPVLTDIGTQKAPVARVARPAPVVGLTAEHAGASAGA